VDLETADDTLTFTLDRKLIGNPLDLYFQVLLGVERDGAEEGEEMDGDAYPDEGEPPAVYRIGATDW